MSYRRIRPSQTPFVLAVEVSGLGWIVVSALIANSFLAAVLVVLSITLGVKVLVSRPWIPWWAARWEGLSGGSLRRL